jgi:hypothetical protein
VTSVHQAFERIRNRIKQQIDDGLDVVAEGSKERIKHSISTPYPPASQPGEPPHERSGELMRSIQAAAANKGQVSVFSDCPHAVFVEYGTERMAPRPFIGSEAEYLRSHGGDELGAAIRKEGRGIS